MLNGYSGAYCSTDNGGALCSTPKAGDLLDHPLGAQCSTSFRSVMLNWRTVERSALHCRMGDLLDGPLGAQCSTSGWSAMLDRGTAEHVALRCRAGAWLDCQSGALCSTDFSFFSENIWSALLNECLERIAQQSSGALCSTLFAKKKTFGAQCSTKSSELNAQRRHQVLPRWRCVSN